jgi:hypothetical protein
LIQFNKTETEIPMTFAFAQLGVSLQTQLITSLACLLLTTFVGASVLTQTALGQSDDNAVWIKQMEAINPAINPPFEIDESLVRAAGIQKISGLHLDLYTDVRDPSRFKDLPAVFDSSVAQWCHFFGVPVDKAQAWKLRAFLIADRNNTTRFQRAGLMPQDLPEFLAGFQKQHNLWFFLQPSEYYTRHLMIHEGTHGFMLWFLGGYGSPWFSEGTAELLGVHQWQNQRLSLRYRLRDRTEAPYWGRVKRIQDEHKSGEAMTLEEVLQIKPTAFLQVRYYAWAWAGCEFFVHHEKSRKQFLEMISHSKLNSNAFNRKLKTDMRHDWDELARDWELFVAEMEYGYEVARGRIVDAEPVARQAQQFKILSNHSWQNTSIKLKQGDKIQISGSGEFVVSSQSKVPNGVPWNCQSNGITIQYYRGHPLGMLHAGIMNPTLKTAKDQVAGLLKPIPVGQSTEFTASQDGVLCLRINESPSQLDDNQGGLEVTVKKLE